MDDPAATDRLVAVVVTYNRLDQLKVTLAKLLQTPQPSLQAVVVVDNASTDDTAPWLATQNDPRLIVHRSDINRGGAGGFETGMRLAVDRFDPDWLLIQDDDARPTSDGLAAFHSLDKSNVDAVAAAVYFPDGRICEMNRPSRNPFWHGAEFLQTMMRGRGGFHLRSDAYQARDGQPIDVTSFVGFFISRRGVALAGYPDPGLFIYGDDGIYTLGLRQAGGRMRFEPSLHFEHDCSTFATQQRGRFHPLWKAYYYHRNLLLLYRMAAGWMFWPVLLVILPKWLLKVRAHNGQHRPYLRLLWRAVRDGLLRRTHIRHEDVLRWSETGVIKRDVPSPLPGQDITVETSQQDQPKA